MSVLDIIYFDLFVSGEDQVSHSFCNSYCVCLSVSFAFSVN